MPSNRMLVKREIETYAEVLLEATQAKGNTFEAASQLEELQGVIRMHPGLREALSDGTSGLDCRMAIVTEVFKGFDESVLKMFSVMVERQELSLLHRVVEEFGRLAEETLGVVIVDVTTVIELDDTLRNAIKAKLAKQFDKEVMLREHIDPSILGGIILGAHGKRIDASVATRLDQTRAALSSQMSGGER